jgi:hypothetical protein
MTPLSFFLTAVTILAAFVLAAIFLFPPRYDPTKYRDDVELDLVPAHYPNNGLYPASYLHSGTSLKAMLAWTLEEQAELADAISRRYCMNPRFLAAQLPEVKRLHADHVRFGILNPTSFGNMAVVRLFNPNNREVQDAYDRFVGIVRDAYRPRNETRKVKTG